MLNIVRRACGAVGLGIFSLIWIAPQAFAQLLPPLPLPGGSLIVAITSPAPDSIVNDTATVSANVTIIGSLTVSSVQFRLDGANLGARDTSAPYSISWDTTTASNGSHTLTAVARNVLGAEFTSAPVTATVSNIAPSPLPVRFEETDPSITYTAGWRSDAHGSASGGTAAISDTAGAPAPLSLRGGPLSWSRGRPLS